YLPSGCSRLRPFGYIGVPQPEPKSKKLEEELRPTDRASVIDEIQRLPELLHEVHGLIEKRKIHFSLTASSANANRLCPRSSIFLTSV
ncbi:MAG TPA: hypothetical protein VNN76_11305, partial [Bacteroidota bacterium]|nr:hypothetical protein [Bacteroidota bacterium]